MASLMAAWRVLAPAWRSADCASGRGHPDLAAAIERRGVGCSARRRIEPDLKQREK